MALRKKTGQVMMTTTKAVIIMVMLLILTLGVSHVLTGGGVRSTNIKFGNMNLFLGGLSALLVGIYGYYHKIYHLYSLILALIVCATFDYQNSVFIIDGKIESLFLGLYLILVSGTVFTMIASRTDMKRKKLTIHMYTVLSLVLAGIYFLIKQFFIPNPVIFQNTSYYIAELILVGMVPFLFSMYYIYIAKKQDLFSFSIFFSTVCFFVAIVSHSLFLRTLDYRWDFTAKIFEAFMFGGYLVFIPLSLLETLRDKDEIIRKSNILKNNLFMFFKSAEYNENITVFVNSNHEILYSNAKYKVFFNNHGNELQKELSTYLTEKYEVIKYNMNYSSSIKVKKQNRETVLDLDVVFIEQNDEEIFCITAKDSTVIRNMQESLKRSEYKYRSFFNLIPDFIFLYDIGEEKIIEANDMVYSNFKISQENAVRENHLDDKFMGLTFREFGEIGNKLHQGEIVKLETMTIKNVRGEDRHVEPNFRLLSFEEHQKQMLVFYKDVTNAVKLHELRVTNEATNRELAIARENEKMFNEFFANMSHELRTPINIILSALEMMEISSTDEEKVAKYGKFIRHNAYRLTRMVNNILDITKVDSGFYNLDMENYELIGFIEDIVTSIIHYAHGKGINIIFDTEEEEYYIAFDLEALERVMLNLLSNAIKFSKVGGTIYVNVHMDREHQKVLIDVKDNGIGIPQDNLDKIFDRFIQVNKSTTRDNEGTGIGLSIVKKLMVLMGGDCQVQSTIGVGTQFTLILNDEVIRGMKREEDEEFLHKREKRVEIEFSDFRN